MCQREIACRAEKTSLQKTAELILNSVKAEKRGLGSFSLKYWTNIPFITRFNTHKDTTRDNVKYTTCNY